MKHYFTIFFLALLFAGCSKEQPTETAYDRLGNLFSRYCEEYVEITDATTVFESDSMRIINFRTSQYCSYIKWNDDNWQYIELHKNGKFCLAICGEKDAIEMEKVNDNDKLLNKAVDIINYCGIVESERHYDDRVNVSMSMVVDDRRKQQAFLEKETSQHTFS